MWAVLFIPVSLAAIIFYIFPLMVAAVVVYTDRGAIPTLGLIAFPLAFVGLGLAIGPSFEVLDWRGVALALVGALAAATTTLVSVRVVGDVNELALALYVNVVGILLMCMLLPLFGGLVLPTLLSGWFGAVGVGVCAVGGISLVFVAIRYAGPARSALFLNSKPIHISGAAPPILGERLGPVQLLGAACVVVALLLASRARSG
jgi:drug/metabolite transporter (DMT)-like permease